MSNKKSQFPERYFGSIPNEVRKISVSEYDRRLPKYRKKHLLQFILTIPENGRLLDLGCGKGKSLMLVQAFRPDITIDACDLTDTSAFLPKNVNFVKCEVDEAINNFPSESFDAIINEHVIEHLVYPTTMIESCFKLLKGGGRVFIETPNWTRLILPFSPLYFWNDYTHIHPFCVGALRRMFTDYGFEEEYVSSVSSIDFGKRFLKLRIEEGQIKTGLVAETKVFKPKESKIRKIFNAMLDLTIHPIARDILIGVAKKPDDVK